MYATQSLRSDGYILTNPTSILNGPLSNRFHYCLIQKNQVLDVFL